MNLTIGGVTCKSRTVRTVLKKLEPEEAKKVLDEKTQGVDARREKRMMKKGPAAASSMCLISICCFQSCNVIF